MSSLATKKAMATALAGAAIASSLAAPAVSARPVEQSLYPETACEQQWVRAYGTPAPASCEEQALAMHRTGAPAEPAGDEPSPSNGFDLPSAAIGAAAGTGLVIVLLAAGGLARRGALTRSHRAAGA
jgi:hypothetical protein